MLRIRPFQNELLSLRRRLPSSLRRWLATRWRRAALTHTDKATAHLAKARECRAAARQIEPTDAPIGADKEE